MKFLYKFNSNFVRQCYDSNQNSDFLQINKWVHDLHENKKITMFDSCQKAYFYKNNNMITSQANKMSLMYAVRKQSHNESHSVQLRCNVKCCPRLLNRLHKLIIYQHKT